MRVIQKHIYYPYFNFLFILGFVVAVCFGSPLTASGKEKKPKDKIEIDKSVRTSEQVICVCIENQCYCEGAEKQQTKA